MKTFIPSDSKVEKQGKQVIHLLVEMNGFGEFAKSPELIDVAVIQNLVRKGVVDEIVSQYGHVIVDECHHLSAFSFEQIVRQTKAKFITGLSATVTRKDGLHPLFSCGVVRLDIV